VRKREVALPMPVTTEMRTLPVGNKKRNALKHGANAKEIMLWSERYEDYDSLRADLRLEFLPSGSTEEYLVRTLVDLRWRRRRLECHEQIVIQQRLNKVRDENEYSHHVDNLRSFASEFGKATSEEQVEAVLAPLSPLYNNTIRNRWPFKAGDDPQKWGPKIAEGLLAWKREPRYEQADEFTKILDLDEFDAALDRTERLDAMIDRTIKRLMQLKTMKQMHGRLESKLIDVPATKNLPAPGRTESPSNK
jgi:hypothetical protein